MCAREIIDDIFNGIILLFNILILVLNCMPEEVAKSRSYYNVVIIIIKISILVLIMQALRLIMAIVLPLVMELFVEKYEKKHLDDIINLVAFLGAILLSIIIYENFVPLKTALDYIANRGI